MANYDFIVSVGIDKEKLMSDFLKGFNAIKDKAESDNSIKYKITADEKVFYDSIKKLLSSSSILQQDIKIGIDTDYYKKSLDTLNKYTGKSVDQIRNSLGRGFSDVEKFDLSKIIEGNLSENKIKTKITNLKNDISTSLTNIDVGDFKQVDDLINKVKELQSIKDQLSSKGKYSKYSNILSGDISKNSIDQLINSVKTQYSQAMVLNRDIYTTQMKSEMEEVNSSVQSLFNDLFNRLFDEAGNLKDNLSTSISSGVQQGVNDAKSAISDLQKQLQSVNKEIDELNSKKDNAEIRQLYDDSLNALYNQLEDVDADFSTENVNKYVEATKKYVATLEESSKEYEYVISDYNDIIEQLGSEGAGSQLPLINSMKTYTDLMNEALVKQSSINIKIEEQQKLLEQVNKETSVSPTQEFDNVVQHNLVMLENYKNTLVEIDKLKIQPETSAIKNKLEELNQLADYFVSQITVIQSEDRWHVSPEMMQSMYGWNTNLTENYSTEQIKELYNVAKEKSGTKIYHSTPEFKYIEEELSNIESKSESLRQSLNKDLTDSTKYVKELRYNLQTLGDCFEILHDPSYANDTGYLEAANYDIEHILDKMPELEQFKDMFHSTDEAREFIKTDKWNDFLATLPQAHTYLESIGYDFEKVAEDTSETSQSVAKASNKILEFKRNEEELASVDSFEEQTESAEKLYDTLKAVRDMIIESNKIVEEQGDYTEAAERLDDMTAGTLLAISEQYDFNAKRLQDYDYANMNDDELKELSQKIFNGEIIPDSSKVTEFNQEIDKLEESLQTVYGTSTNFKEKYMRIFDELRSGAISYKEALTTIVEEQESILAQQRVDSDYTVQPSQMEFDIPIDDENILHFTRLTDEQLKEKRDSVDQVTERISLLEDKEEELIETEKQLGSSDNIKEDISDYIKEEDVIESVNEALKEKQKNESIDSDNLSSEEIEFLKELKTKLEEVKTAIREKTEAFANEASAVSIYVESEIANLELLIKKLDEVEQKIDASLNVLRDSNNTKIVFTPELADDFDSIAQKLIETKQYKVKLSPKLVDDFVKKLQSLINKSGKFEINLFGNNDVTETKDNVVELTEAEKELDSAAQSWVEDNFYNIGLSKKALSELKNEVIDIIKVIKSGGDADSSGLFNIIGNDSQYLKKRYSKELDEYNNVRQYVSQSKIRITDFDKEEFGDYWSKIRGKIGLNVFSATEGQEADQFLEELNRQFSITSVQARNSADAIKILYDYLSNPPDLKSLFISDKEADLDNEIQSYNDQLSTLSEKLKFEAPQQTSDGITEYVAKNIEELEKYNTKYATELEDLRENREREEELFNQINDVEKESNNALTQSDTRSEAVKEMSEAFESEENTVKDIILNEQQLLEALINSIRDVINEVNAKTNAFKDEEKTVEGVVRNEINALNTLSEALVSLRADINNSTLNVSVNGDASEITNFTNSLSKISDKRISSKFDNISSSLKKIVDTVNGLKIDDNTILSSLNQLLSKTKELDNLTTALKSSKKQIEEAKKVVSDSTSEKTETSNIDKAIELYNKLYSAKIKQSKIKAGTNQGLAQFYSDEINKLQQEIDNLTLTEEEAGEVAKATAQKEAAARNAASESIRKEKEELNKLIDSAEDLQTQVKKQATSMLSNGKLMSEYGDRVREIIQEIDNINTEVDPSAAKEKLRQLKNELENISSAAKEAGKSGESFGQTLTKRFKSLVAYLSTFVQFYDIVRYVRSAFETIKDLDTQLVDLRKTTVMNTKELNEFYNSSSDVAKQLGVTTSEIISQASAWSRLGYNTQEASTTMAELSSKFASVSPGMTTENATDYLVSTMQAYGIAVDEVERKVMDNVNRIGNTFATTNAEIGEMLTRSSAAMKAANNTIEETIALESAAVQITRNAETTGTAFRTISMRIRGYDEETEELSSDLENISGDIYDLTRVNGGKGISIFTDETRTTYKSTYEILKEIAGVWDELTDKQQADLLDKLGGKRGAQSIAGILSDFSEVERAMTEMENAAGSADQEMGIIRDSLEFKINALKQTWVGVLQEVTDRGEIGTWVDRLTAISEGLGGLISKLGLVKTALIGVSTVVGSQKLGILDTQNSNTLIGALTQSRLGKADVNSYQSLISEIQSHGLASNYFVDGLDVSQLKGSETFIRNITDIQNKLKETGGTGQDAINKIIAVMGDAEEKANTLSTKFTSLGKTLLNGLASAVISTAISLLITKISEMTDKLIITRKEAKTLSDQFHDTFSSAVADQSKGLSQISGIEKEYEELSEGVSALGENVSLTDAQFERYHEITQIIAENIPSLIQGYDDQGEAIIRLKDNVKDLTQAYNENQEAAALERYNEVDSNGGVIAGVYQNAKNDMESVTVETSHSATGLVAHEQTIDIIQQLETRKKLAQASVKELQQLWKEGSIYEKQLLEEVGFRDVLSDSELSTIQSKLQKNSTQLEKTLEYDAKTVSEAGLTYAQAWEGYYTELTSEQQKYVSSVMNSMDFDYIYENGLYDQDAMELYVQNLMDTVKSLSSEDMAKIQIGIDISTQWNNNKLSYEEYIKKLQEFDELLETLFPGNEQLQTSIKLLFDIPEIEDVEEEIDKRVNRGQRVISNKYGSNKQPTFNEESDNNNSLGGKTLLAQDFLNGEEEVKVPLVAEPQPITSDQYEKWGELYTEFQKKLSTEEAKVLNDLSDDELVITYDFESVEDFEDWFASLQAVADENPIEIKATVSGLTEDLNEFKDSFDGLDTVYETTVTNAGTVDASDLYTVNDDMGGVTFNESDITKVNAMSSAIEKYNQELAENPNNAEAAQESVNDLATSYINLSGVMDNVTEESKELAIEELELNGITNAEEVVNSRLTKRYEKFSSAIQKVSKKVAQYHDVLEQGESAGNSYNEAIEDMIDEVQELVDVYDDEGTKLDLGFEVDPDFITENLEKIQRAAEDDTDAIDELRIAAAKKIYADVELFDDNFWADCASVQSMIAQLDADDFTIDGYMNNSDIISKLNQINSECIRSGQNFAEVLSYITGGAITAEYEWEEVEATSFNGMPSGLEKYVTNTKVKVLKGVKYKWNGSSYGSSAKYGGTGGSSSSNGGSSDGGSSDSSEDTEETFDWVEQKLTRLEENLERINTQVDDTYKNWTNRNEELGKAINQVSEEIKAQEKAAEIYQAKADAVDWGSTSEETKQAYITKIKNGEIIDTSSIETIKNNETLVDAINEYKEWYDLSVEAADTGKELAVTLKDYYKDLFDNIQSEYDDLIEDIEKQADTIDERISRTEERGFFVDKAYYDSLVTLESQKTEKLSTELNLLISKLNNQVENGQIEKYSESWYEMYNAIQDVNIALEESYTRTAELNNEIRQLSWDAFDWVEERMDDFAEEADFLIGLLQGEETIDDRGYFNDRGFANAALIGAKYDDALAEAQRYKEQIAKIDEQIATTEGAYDKNLIERKEELVDAYRDAIEAAEDEKQAMKSLVEEAVKQHLDYLSKLIDKYKDALSTMKSTYEYAKNINDQTKNIGNLEKQLAAYQGDTSEETRKKRQELQSQLDAAQQQLEETQWDKYISETGEMLDNLYNDYETYLNDKLSNVSELMNSMIDMINQGTYTVPGAVTLGMNNILSQLSGNGSITTAVKDTTISIQTGMDEIKSEYDLTTQNFEKFGDTANGTKNILSGWSNGKYTNESTFKTKLDEVKEKFEKVTNGAADTIKKAITENSVDIKSNDEAGHVSKQKTYVDPNAGGGGGGGGGEQPTSGQDPNSTGNATSNAGWYQREGLDLWFFRNEDGTDKQAEWFRDDENGGWWYWFDPGGVMARDEYVSDDNGDFWYLDDSGHMMPNKFNWHQDDNGWWFGSDDGTYVHDEEVTINGERWRFNHAGYQYAKGTKGVPNNQLAWTQEEGSELIYRTTDGALLTPLGKGDMVFTNAMSQRLWDIASGSMPFGFDLDSPNVSANANQSVTANNSITIELPNVQNYDDFKREMKQDTELEKFWQEITIGQMMGNARLKKNKY